MLYLRKLNIYLNFQRLSRKFGERVANGNRTGNFRAEAQDPRKDAEKAPTIGDRIGVLLRLSVNFAPLRDIRC
jgi:hypothetical protein